MQEDKNIINWKNKIRKNNKNYIIKIHNKTYK